MLTAAVTLVLGSGALPFAAQAGEEMFRAGLDDVRDLMDRREWEDARQHIHTLLRQHEEQPYVFVERAEVVDRLKRCRFWEEYVPAEPAELISGRLVSYSPSGGNLRIVYDPESMEDFLGSGKSLRIHPAVFVGPYNIEVKGTRYPHWEFGKSPHIPGILVDAATEGGFLVIFGLEPVERGGQRRWAPAQIRRYGERRTVLASRKESPVKPGKKFSLKVRVRHGSIGGFYNGRKIIHARRERVDFGSFGILNFAPCDEIVVEGKAERAWIQGLLDDHRQRAWDEFERSSDIDAELPEWLVPKDSLTFHEMLTLPCEPDERSSAVTNEALELMQKGYYDEGLQLVQGVASSDLHEDLRQHFIAVFLFFESRYTEALVHASHVTARYTDAFAARAVRALALYQQGRWRSAAKELQDLMELEPEASWIHPIAARVELGLGNSARAREIIERATAASCYTHELARVHHLMSLAEMGPCWSAVHDYTSDHFHVSSDIDRRTCVEVARVLESGLKRFTSRLGPVPNSRELFRVYVFSGMSGYQDYTVDVLESKAEHTAGLYSPLLKQLLIWNVPEREKMMETVRHEGFHQYLHSRMADAPIWLNEGLAEYFENADFTRQASDQIRLHPEHLAILHDKRFKLEPLERFVHIDWIEFYNRAPVHYAQAWALVHYLQQGPREHRDRVPQLLKLLGSGLDRREAIERTFEGVDFEALQLNLETYVRELGSDR